MDGIFDIAKENQLFRGIAFSDFRKMSECLSAETRRYAKGETILPAGDTADFVGLILSGSVMIKKKDREGRTTIIAELGAPETFGETPACAGISQSPVTVQAAEDSEIFFLNHKRIITSCTSACPFHARLIENMLRSVAIKNIVLTERLEMLSKRTTREKLLFFFDMQRGAARKFTIPFDREELARHLCVDRSAMSSELCKMRREGMIKFRKNTFEILET